MCCLCCLWQCRGFCLFGKAPLCAACAACAACMCRLCHLCRLCCLWQCRGFCLFGNSPLCAACAACAAYAACGSAEVFTCRSFGTHYVPLVPLVAVPRFLPARHLVIHHYVPLVLLVAVPRFLPAGVLVITVCRLWQCHVFWLPDVEIPRFLPTGVLGPPVYNPIVCN
jgi:hypothetical protein